MPKYDAIQRAEDAELDLVSICTTPINIHTCSSSVSFISWIIMCFSSLYGSSDYIKLSFFYFFDSSKALQSLHPN